ncbi:MAG: hypothetical protein KUG77_03930, partial [Nannocystaceae bacterium]|nr:hypothetical protein [Nannocystaceae bacterium]
RGRRYYPVHDPERLPTSYSRPPIENFYKLGGGAPTQAVVEDTDFTPPFVQTLVPLSQRWCMMAVDKEDNTALFRHGSPQTGSDEPGVVKDNIRALSLHMLAEPATDAQVEAIFDEVFVPLESDGDNDSRTAWVGVCSYFVRHPLFLVY